MLRQSLLMSLITVMTWAETPALKQPAPAFEAMDQHGKVIRLSDFKGKNVVLYFYPKDDTPGCTAQACSLRDGHGELLKRGAVVLGVSMDDIKSHKAFSDKYKLPFSLLADPEGKITQSYGVKMPLLSMAKRWTFIIDGKGVLQSIIQNVNTQKHDEQVIQALDAIPQK